MARAHSRIETEGVDNMVISNFELHNFIPLLCSTHDWGLVASALENMEHQDNTHILLEKLSRPINQIFDMSQKWIADEFEKYHTNPNQC